MVRLRVAVLLLVARGAFAAVLLAVTTTAALFERGRVGIVVTFVIVLIIVGILGIVGFSGL